MRVLITLAALYIQVGIAYHDFRAHHTSWAHFWIILALWFVVMACHKTNKASR